MRVTYSESPYNKNLQTMMALFLQVNCTYPPVVGNISNWSGDSIHYILLLVYNLESTTLLSSVSDRAQNTISLDHISSLWWLKYRQLSTILRLYFKIFQCLFSFIYQVFASTMDIMNRLWIALVMAGWIICKLIQYSFISCFSGYAICVFNYMFLHMFANDAECPLSYW